MPELQQTLEGDGCKDDSDESSSEDEADDSEHLSPVVSAMVDAVLPSPRLGAIRDPLVTTLCEEGWLHPLHEKLGAATAADGRVRREDGSPAPGLALLGRLAQGSVIAVDSIHDCFGAAADRWAEAVLERQAGQD